MNANLTLHLGLSLALGLFRPGVTNAASGFQSDVEAFIQEEVEPLARRANDPQRDFAAVGYEDALEQLRLMVDG